MVMEFIEEGIGTLGDNDGNSFILKESSSVDGKENAAQQESNVVEETFGIDRSMKVSDHKQCEDDADSCLGESVESVVEETLGHRLAGTTGMWDQIINNDNGATFINSIYFSMEGLVDTHSSASHEGHSIVGGENDVSKSDNSNPETCLKGMDISANCAEPSSVAFTSNSEQECFKSVQTHSELLPVYPHNQLFCGFESLSKDYDCLGEEQVQFTLPVDGLIPRASKIGRRGQPFFFYELPLPEETGSWIPVSVPPMEAEEFERSLYEDGVYGGGYFPEVCCWPEGSDRYQPDTKTTDELYFRKNLYGVLEALFGKGKALIETIELIWSQPHTSVNYSNGTGLLTQPPNLIDETNKLHMSPFTGDAGQDVWIIKEVLEADPPEWIPDSAASSCMRCRANFRPFTCARHHCRFCGGIFCNGCSNGRCLLPVRFRERDPQRVCDICWQRLEPTQRILADQVSNAAQIATRDVTDFSCLRAWLNSPFGLSMEQEIFKATNALRSYHKMGLVTPERSIPEAVLKGARGLAIITVVKVGMMMTYKIGTGLVVARRVDGTWSAPSALASCGIGWGLQAGGELTDFIIVLRTVEAVRAFAGCVHLSVGASLSAAAGPVGRAAEADIRAGDGGAAACFTYSRSKGAFLGCSLESNVVATRSASNTRFYGDSCITTADILLGSIPRPKAAAPLYSALSDLFLKVEACSAL